MTELTGKQRETLCVALELGYFAIPRNAHQKDIAQRVGVSEQAVQERLARAHRTLAKQAVDT
jgi:predicted DNA binding protein